MIYIYTQTHTQTKIYMTQVYRKAIVRKFYSNKHTQTQTLLAKNAKKTTSNPTSVLPLLFDNRKAYVFVLSSKVVKPHQRMTFIRGFSQNKCTVIGTP